MTWVVGGGAVLMAILYYSIPDAPLPAPKPAVVSSMPEVKYDRPVTPVSRITETVAKKDDPKPDVKPDVTENYPRITLEIQSFGGGKSYVPEYLKPAKAQAESNTKRETERIAYNDAKVPAIRSYTIKDRTYELPAFTTIPCLLDTAVVTGASGMTPFRCHIHTPNGRGVRSPADVVLFEDNTTVGGFYKSTVAEGDTRIVMVTAQAETPFGVVVRFGDMPVADPLGAAGVPASIDNRWRQRISGALILGLLDAGLSLAQAELQNVGRNSNNAQFNFGGGGGSISGLSQVTQSVLQKTINIPPIASLHQSDLVQLWVTEMVDFSPSYEVGPRERTR